MPSPQPLGMCFLGKRIYTRRGMVNHLRKHITERGGEASLVWLRVTDNSFTSILPSEYFWLDLELPPNLPLVTLDAFLREVWVECCGHLSQFVVHWQGSTFWFTYASENALAEGIPREELQRVADASGEPDWLYAQKLFGAGVIPLFMEEYTVADIISVVDTFVYEYDFGSTTRLKIQVRARYDGPEPPTDEPIRILSRNLKPRILCEQCDRLAEFVDVSHPEGRFLCAEHAHQEDRGLLLPLVNSPRTGVCGYIGPPDERLSFEVVMPPT